MEKKYEITPLSDDDLQDESTVVFGADLCENLPDNTEMDDNEKMDAATMEDMLQDNSSDFPEEIKEIPNKLEYVDKDLTPCGSNEFETAQILLEQKQQRREEARTRSVLLYALKNRKIMGGVISNVRSSGDSAGWLIQEEGASIYIPINETFQQLPEEFMKEKLSRTLVERARQFLSRSIGAEISYIITSCGADADGNTIFIASRRKSLDLIRKKYFGPTASNPLEKGMDVYPKIISIGPSAAYVSCCGMDIRLNKELLTHKYISRTDEYFSVGQSIHARITSIEPAPSPDELPILKISARAVELSQMKNRLHTVKVGDRIAGIVTSSRFKTMEEGNQRLIVCLDLVRQKLAGFASTLDLRLQDRLYKGDEVIFEVHGFTDEGYVHGSILYITKHK